MKTIGICMIVKNESHVIERALDSCKEIADYFLIEDTGSTDDTVKKIEHWLKTNYFPGEVIYEPWQNFAYNRTHLCNLIKQKEYIDYAFMLDADTVLKFSENFDYKSFKTNLNADVYSILNINGTLEYFFPLLIKNSLSRKYISIVHEYPVIENSSRTEYIRDPHVIQKFDSNRNKSGNKFLSDIKLLEKELESEKDDGLRARYIFYLAESYKHSRILQIALNLYLDRSKLGFWIEEVYMSFLNAGRLMETLSYSDEMIIQTYMKATECLPIRVEALHDAIKFCRNKKLYQQGYILGKHALDIPLPPRSLFVEKWIYDYGVLDEFSICAYWTGHYKEAKEASERLIAENKYPIKYEDRIKNNLKFAISKL